MSIDALALTSLVGESLIIDMSGYTGFIDPVPLEPYVDGREEPRIHGVILRLSDGTKEDACGIRNYLAWKSLGVPLGVYGTHYGRRTAASNKRQAEKLLSELDKLPEYPKLGVFGDWERDPDNLTIAEMRLAIWKYITTFEDATQKTLGVYTNAWWDANVANTINGATDIPKGDSKPGFNPRGRPMWAASWYSKKPYVAWDWRQRYGQYPQELHQYDNRFRFPGIPGSVDASTFNGTLAEYHAYYKLEGTPPPPPPPPPVADEHWAEVLIKNLSIRNEPVYGKGLYGLGVLNGRVRVGNEVVNGYRRVLEGWVWDKSIKLLD